jgi:hypothetical protein
LFWGEAKLRNTELLRHWRKFLGQLGYRRAMQRVSNPGCFRMYTEGGVALLIASAGDALTYFA